MTTISGYTLAEAQEMLALWKAAERELASGQAKHYRIGTREYTSVDLPEIAARIRHFAALVDSMSGRSRARRVVRVVPRDL